MTVYRWVDEAGEHYSEVPAGEKREDYGIPKEAQTVSRMPQDFERWDDQAKAWVKDKEAEAEHLEDARLRLLSPSKRHQETIQKAAERIQRGGPL